MAKIGVSVCPFMTRDPANPAFCRRDCACFLAIWLLGFTAIMAALVVFLGGL